MTQYKFISDDRNYNSWNIYNNNDGYIDPVHGINIDPVHGVNIDPVHGVNIEPVHGINIDPVHGKLFSGDIFIISNEIEHTIKIVQSIYRHESFIPGILVLSDGKTYGNSNNRLLYKCIPNDIRIPIFLIPYQIKTNFSKKQDDLYVLFRYENWNDKHPIGILDNVIGSVIELVNYYEYQLYCKGLHTSIQMFNKQVNSKCRNTSEQDILESILKKNPLIEDRRSEHIITIDSSNTTDYDDAIGIVDKLNDIGIVDKLNDICLSIYIANVPIWIEELKLWQSFSDRVSTIYLPDKKRSMIPSLLSDNLCSLKEGYDKIAFVMDIYIDRNTGLIKTVEYKNAIIRITKNHIYDSKPLKHDNIYRKIQKQVIQLHEKYTYVQSIKSSTDVIAYLMILMNHYTANEMIKYKIGIYRSVQFIERNKIDIKDDLPDDVNKFLKVWNSSFGSYTLYDNRSSHALMELESYTHITSPIRRLVDLLNIMILQQKSNIYSFGVDAMEFYNRWLERIEFINISMKSTRKVQNDCNLLELITNSSNNVSDNVYNNVSNNIIYDGYVFDKSERNDGKFQYTVYLPDIKMISQVIIEDSREKYEKMKFHIYIFHDEENLKKKIRLYPIE